VGSNPQ